MNMLFIRFIFLFFTTASICYSFPKEATDYFGSNGAKWAFNQKSRDGITWADTTWVRAYTYNIDSNVVTIDVYQKDTNVTPSIWRISENTNFSMVSNNPKKATGLTLIYNTKSDLWDTTHIYYYNFNENYTVASLESQSHISIYENQSIVACVKTIYWYEGTRISADSTVYSIKAYVSGNLDLSFGDTSLQRYSRVRYVYTDSSRESIYAGWDPTLKVWVESSKCISTLNTDKKPLISITTEKGCDTCVIISKDSILYTETGKIAEQVHMQWQQDTWVLDNRTVFMTTNPPGFVKVDVHGRSAKRMIKRTVLFTGKSEKYDLCGRAICNDSKTVPTYRITRSVDRKKASGAVIFK